MEILSEILKNYGIGGLVLVALIYIILKGQFSFQYPRSKGNPDED